MGEYAGINSNFTEEYIFRGALINIDKQLERWYKYPAGIVRSQCAIVERDVSTACLHDTPGLHILNYAQVTFLTHKQ